MGLTREQIIQALDNPVDWPGMRAGGSGGHRPAKFRDAAVLVLFVEHDDDLSLLLTRRTDHLPAHAGQISFPGGTKTPEDASIEATALRETQEEIGVAASDIELAGRLSPFETGTGFRVWPLIGFIKPGTPITPDASEVAEVFEIPVSFAFDRRNHQRLSLVREGHRRRFFAMSYAGRFIWGATARIIVLLARKVHQS